MCQYPLSQEQTVTPALQMQPLQNRNSLLKSKKNGFYPAIDIEQLPGSADGIKEQYAVNEANGTFSLQLALPLFASRNGFTPELSLCYNSESGNSPFGLGWNIDLPRIKCKANTSFAAQSENLFLLVGIGDLVPKLHQQISVDWLLVEITESIAIPSGKKAVAEACLIKEYRTGLNSHYLCVEHIISKSKGSWWRTITREGITTWYGLTAAARITDIADDSHIYEWLPQLVTDGKGNVQHLVYKPENCDNMPAGIFQTQDGVNLPGHCNNLYLKNIRYGNRTPFSHTGSYAPPLPDKVSDFQFELVFDYGEHCMDYTAGVQAYAPIVKWPCRDDAFTECRDEYKLHIKRRCERLLLFNRSALLQAPPMIVRSIELSYSHSDLNDATVALLAGITPTDYNGANPAGVRKIMRLPAMVMTYTLHKDLHGVAGSYLMTAYRSSGRSIRVAYKSARQYCVEDQERGAPWNTKAPDGRQCVSRISFIDPMSGTEYSSSYSYHHGCYCSRKDEFQGFCRVERIDTISKSPKTLVNAPATYRDPAPVLTKTWYHNNAWLLRGTQQDSFASEYSKHQGAPPPRTQVFLEFKAEAADIAALAQQAANALSRATLRQEVYILSNPEPINKPDAISIYTYYVMLAQPFHSQHGPACFRIKHLSQLFEMQKG